MLRGNHEHTWLEWLTDTSPYQLPSPDKKTKKQFGSKLPDLALWIQTLPAYVEMDRFILTHGGMEIDRSFEEQKMEPWIGSRSMAYIPTSQRNGKTIIHGHTVVPKPLIRQDRINLDTGCVQGGELTAYCLETHTYIQVKKKDNFQQSLDCLI